MNNRYPVYLLFALVLFGSAMLSEQLLFRKQQNFEAITRHATESLNALEKQSVEVLNRLATLKFDADPVAFTGIPTEEIPVKWLSLFVYKGDSLLWWSDNSVQPKKSMLESGFFLL